MVHPDWQGQGIGTVIMAALMGWLERHAAPGSVLGLMAAEGKASFYHRYGFVERPPGRPGMSRHR